MSLPGSAGGPHCLFLCKMRIGLDVRRGMCSHEHLFTHRIPPMRPSYAKMPNTVLRVACGAAEWRRLITAANEGGSPLWIGWLRENYFASLAWRRKQEARLELDGKKCACCGDACSPLEVHHKSEANFGDEHVATDL